MFKTKLRISRAASAFAIVLALFSTGVVVAHSCHTQVATAEAHIDHGHALPGQIAGSAENLLEEICIGLVFFFLLFGRKYLQKLLKVYEFFGPTSISRQTFKVLRPPNLTYSLSLSQLGISRI